MNIQLGLLETQFQDFLFADKPDRISRARQVMPNLHLLLTCEHATNHVPKAYLPQFVNAEESLASHRGWDPGALVMAKLIAKRLRVGLLHTNFSRLLIEPNRSLHHPALFSKYTAGLDATTKEKLIDQFYQPHWDAVRSQVEAAHQIGETALHVSIHSFTPNLNGQIRNADVGWLYDPTRPGEKQFCSQWLNCLKQTRPDLRLRRNYPYLGIADGMTTSLRKKFDSRRYLGIELEVNQQWWDDRVGWNQLAEAIAMTLKRTLAKSNAA